MNDMQQLEIVSRISDLLYKYIFKEINDDELVALHAWAYANPANQELFEEISDPSNHSSSIGSLQQFKIPDLAETGSTH